MRNAATLHGTFDHNGVLLDYADPSIRREFHVERTPHRGDRRRCALIQAEREILALTIIFDHLELSGIARTRLDDALARIRRGLAISREHLGLQRADA